MNDEMNNSASGEITDLSDLSNFFAPSWAKNDESSNVKLVSGGNDRRRDDRGPRPPRRENRNHDDRPPRGPRRDGESRSPRRDFEERPKHPRRDGDFRPRGDHEAPAKPQAPRIDIAVRFLPDGKALDAIIRRIQTTHKAYPFRDIVRLFQKDDASLVVRMEANREANPDAKLYQCRVCGMPGLTEAEITNHIFEKHIADYFDIETVEGEAPQGNFTLIAKCGLSGELLGPPNHHSYVRRMAEIMHDRYPNMSKEEYSRHIEMVRDPEVIEEWRNQTKMRTLYFRKPQEDGAERAAGVERHEAEAIFRRDILPGQIGAAPHIVCPATILKNMPNRHLASYLSRAFSQDEQMRSQGTLSKALHAAFHHRKLHFFHANDDHGQEFVTFAAPVKFDTENVTDEIRAIISYVQENPSSPVKNLVDAMVADGDEEKQKAVSSSIRWLVEKGHLVEYFNGFISPAASHPVFRLTPKKEKKTEEKAKAEEAAPAAEVTPEVAPEAAQKPIAEPVPETESADGGLPSSATDNAEQSNLKSDDNSESAPNSELTEAQTSDNSELRAPDSELTEETPAAADTE